jgi:hypothetical protein
MGCFLETVMRLVDERKANDGDRQEQKRSGGDRRASKAESIEEPNRSCGGECPGREGEHSDEWLLTEKLVDGQQGERGKKQNWK